MPKNKQQEAQEKRLQKNIRQAKKTGADAKQGKTKSARSKPSKKGGFFAGLKADAPQTVQQSIPYREMYRDGICRLTDTLYTKTVQFFDINYQLAQADDKAQIFEGYCDFLNYFDASIHVQLTFINQRANMQDFTKSIDIPPRGDEYDGIRKEYGDMLKNQLQKGNNGLTKRKYITFGIEADDLRTAKMRLERIETDVLANFKTLGVQARSLNGLERLELLHSQLHPDGQEKFHFQWSDLPKTGLSIAGKWEVSSCLPLHIPVPVLCLLLLAACAVHNRFHPVQLHQIVLDRFVLCVVPLVLVLAPLLSLAV